MEGKKKWASDEQLLKCSVSVDSVKHFSPTHEFTYMLTVLRVWVTPWYRNEEHVC